MLESERFIAFFDHTSKIAERALNEPFDVLVNFAAPNAKSYGLFFDNGRC